MLHTKIVDSKKEKILTSNAEKFIKNSKFGASIYFLGTVRNINDNKIVTGITYDSHDEMVIKSFEEIFNEANIKLNIKDKAVIIEHAKGFLKLGDITTIQKSSLAVSRNCRYLKVPTSTISYTR